MTSKSRQHRVLDRARKAFSRALRDRVGYGEGLLFIQLRMMYLNREFEKKYPRPLPKFTYNFVNK